MTRADDINAAWAEVDTATNSMATRVQALIDEINRTATEGLNGPQTEAVLTRLQSLKNQLEGVGHNPQTPIPTEPPVVPIPGPFIN